MNYGFWNNLPKPFFALAPMYDVTDIAFRSIMLKTGRPDVFYTEFVSSDGLSSSGKDKLMHHLLISKSELPIVAQIFGANPKNFFAASKLVAQLGFSGIDINMGCPDKNIIKGGSCAALFRTPRLAQEIIAATKEGAQSQIPVSIKIRIGDTQINWQNWIFNLLEAKPSAIAIHLRTRKEMSKVPAHWELMPEIANFIRHNADQNFVPKIIGNGDVESLDQGLKLAEECNIDGIMIGRGVFKNLQTFNRSPKILTDHDKIELLKFHVLQYQKYFESVKHYDVLKRHFKTYLNGSHKLAELRATLYETKTTAQALKILTSFKHP